MNDMITNNQEIIELIESNLMNFDIVELKKATGIPLGLYQRFFSYTYGITLISYIRKRKLTVAAMKLLQSEWNVTMASLSCGYEDTSSFSRAFKEQFHVSPSHLTDEYYKVHKYEKLTLANIHKHLDQKAHLQCIEYPIIQEQYLVGIHSKQYQNAIGNDLWDIYRNEHIEEKLCKLECELTQKNDDQYIAVGYMSDFPDSSNLGNEYMIGRLFQSKPKHTMGFTIKKLASMQLVHTKVCANSLHEIINSAYVLTCDAADKNGYEIEYTPFFWMEYYDRKYFQNMHHDGNELVLDFYIPCKKREQLIGGIPWVINEN